MLARIAFAWMAALLAVSGDAAARDGSVPAPPPAWEPVTRQALVAAMRREEGYDRTATTNLARFQARVLLDLAREARERRPSGPPLFIAHEDWFQAYLEALGLPEERAPRPLQLSREHHHDVVIEHRPERVLRRVVKGPAPSLALSVRWEPRAPLVSRGYSYDDLLSRPHLKVRVGGVVTYRLLEVGGTIFYDRIEGMGGRPTSGVLAVLFQLIGDAKAVSSRIAVTKDQCQVVFARGRKGFLKGSATVTVRPDGTAEKGVPSGRPDLARLEALVREPLELEYVDGK